MNSRRGGTPLGVPAPSLEASNQAQIDDLVQRNRTLEHTVRKLSDQVSLEVARSKEAAATIQEQWQQEQREWREGCDVLQSCHRIVQLRNTVELENQRMNVLKELDAVRKEKLKRLQRDFRITMFQVKEAELERRIVELEEEKEILRVEYEEKVKELKAASEEYAAQVTAEYDELAIEKEELEEKLGNLREEHARSNASAEMLTSKLERTTLQLDGAQTKNSDLKRANEELKRSNSEIQRQLTKWQNLETKGDMEVETLRKRRIELEVEVKELEKRLEKSEKSAKDNAAALEKEQRRLEKTQIGITDWQAKAQRHGEEAEEAQRKFEGAQKLVEKLKAQLEVQRTRVRASPRKKSHETSEDEVAHEISVGQESSPLRAKSPMAKPKPRPQRAKFRPRGQKPAYSYELDPSDSNDARDVVKTTKAKGKAKAVDDEVPAKQHGKRKAASRENQVTTDVEILPSPSLAKNKIVSRAVSEARATVTKSKPGKAAHRGGSVQPRQIDEEDTQTSDAADSVPKKKKRKINLFPPNTESTAFDFTPQIDNGLNIPTILSPVQPSEGIPSRSTSGSVMGTIGSMLKNSFAGTRR